MTRTRSTFSLAAIALILASSCTDPGNDTITSKTYNVSDFSSLELEVIGEVYYEQSDSAYLAASGSSALIDALEVSGSNGELTVEQKNKRSFSGSKKELTIRVGSPRLTSIDYRGVGTLHLKGHCEGESLTISDQGVGQMMIEDCHVGTFRLNSRSIGKVEIKGSATDTFIDLEGIGDIDCSEFRSKNVEGVSKGAGNLSVHAEESLEISISGIGSVKYYGDPSEVRSDISGLGKATKM